MQLISTYCLIFIFLCGTYSTESYGQEASAFHKADSLLQSGKFRDAGLEYEYIVFRDSSWIVKNRALMGKAEALKQMGSFDKAQRSLERINFEVMDDSLQFIVRMQTALCAYLAGNFKDAESQLLQIDYYLGDSIYYKKSLPMRILVFNELRDYANAQRCVMEFSNLMVQHHPGTEEINNEFELLYSRRNVPKIKKPETAQLLSTFVPGLGQLYAGYPGEAVLSGLFTAGSLAMAGVAFYFKYWITGYFVGLGLFQKFYFGGQTRVKYLAEKRNYVNCNEFNNKVKMLILDKYKLFEEISF